MRSTQELWEKAMAVATKAEWARRLGMNKATMTRVNDNGHLSPHIAGRLALALGEEPKDWIALAAIEGMKDADETTKRELKLACRYT